MAHATPDDVAALALDPESVPPEVRDHVASCPSCRVLQAGLVAVADGLRRGRDDGPLVAPPDDVRRRVLAAAASGTPQQPGQRPEPPREAPPAALPATSPETPPEPQQLPAAQVPAPAVTPIRDRRRGVPVWAAGLAAAVALVAGLGIGRTTGGTDPEPPAPADLVASAELTTVEGTDPRGLARAVRAADREGDDVVTLRINAEALGDQDGIHEVWLLHTDGTRMVAVGLLAAGEEGEFEVPVELLDAGYRIVDISVEPEDGDPTHSGVSLARGELT